MPPCQLCPFPILRFFFSMCYAQQELDDIRTEMFRQTEISDFDTYIYCMVARYLGISHHKRFLFLFCFFSPSIPVYSMYKADAKLNDFFQRKRTPGIEDRNRIELVLRLYIGNRSRLMVIVSILTPISHHHCAGTSRGGPRAVVGSAGRPSARRGG